MILDSVKNSATYSSLGPAIERAFRYLAGSHFAEMKDGRHEIDGQDLYLLLSSYSTEEERKRKFEAHRSYIDIQVVLAGEELVYWAPVGGLTPTIGYDKEKDIIFFQDPVEPRAGGTGIYLTSGYFAVFFPSDAHKPCCALREPQPVRKAVIKVRA